MLFALLEAYLSFICWSNFFFLFSRDQDILSSNQSLRILLNLVAAGAINSSGILDEIIHELLGFTANVVNFKSPDINDILAKVYPC